MKYVHVNSIRWVVAAVIYSSSASVFAAPSTATFMNVMTVCGAGTSISIDANLQGSIVSLYEQEATKGRAVQQILPEITKLLPTGDVYVHYLECVKDLLTKP
jgi:hypothetical protein